MDPTAPRRNIMLISFDDAVAFWRYKTLFGAALETPNLDRICAQSTAFHAAYTQAPVCNPSRVAMLSGKTPHQTGITMPRKDVFSVLDVGDVLPGRLKAEGWFTSLGGKGLSGFHPFEDDLHARLYSDAPRAFRKDWRVPDKISVALGGFRGGKATVSEAHDGRFYDYQAASSAEEFLSEHPEDQPFFREIGFYGPHGPWITPLRFKKMYPPDGFRQPPAWEGGLPTNPYLDAQFTPNFDPTRPRIWRQSVRNYFSAMSHVDHHLGRVWDALKASKHGDNTVVIITSDHGHHLGERNRFRKHTLYEQVANVPLIIHDPTHPVPQVVTDPVGVIDIVPTVLDYVGLEPPEGCLGQSLRPLMRMEPAPESRAIPTVLRDNVSIRKDRFRFIRYEDGSTEMYDIAADWWQRAPLGPDHPSYGDMAAALEACCEAQGLDLSTVRPCEDAA